MSISLAVRICGCAVVAMAGIAPARAAVPTALHATGAEVRSAAGGLDVAVRAAAAGKAPVWVVWSVPIAVGQGDACCYEGDLSGRKARRRGCRLDGRSPGITISGNEVPDQAADLTVYARFENGAMQQVRAFAASCPVDAGDARLVWLEDVAPAQSVELMSHQARALPRRQGPGDDALVALALHADPAADAALIELAGSRSPMELREDAVFWLGQARGQRGYRELERMAAQESDPRILEKVAFSLSQCPLPAAGPTLERMAMAHGDPRVRQEAIFWMGQRGGPGVAAKLKSVAQQDSDLEVRKKAVFALSQLEDGAGVNELVELVRHARETAVRKEALFWLGQSDDPRAMESLEALLLHP